MLNLLDSIIMVQQMYYHGLIPGTPPNRDKKGRYTVAGQLVRTLHQPPAYTSHELATPRSKRYRDHDLEKSRRVLVLTRSVRSVCSRFSGDDYSGSQVKDMSKRAFERVTGTTTVHSPCTKTLHLPDASISTGLRSIRSGSW